MYITLECLKCNDYTREFKTYLIYLDNIRYTMNVHVLVDESLSVEQNYQPYLYIFDEFNMSRSLSLKYLFNKEEIVLEI